MQEMRQQARELAEQQDALAETLQQEEADPDVSQGLRGSPDRGETTEAMQRQSETLQELLQQMQQTIEQSEEIEPLLAEKLYESFRQSQRDQTKERLALTAELLEQGLTPQAIQMEAAARRGIERLREGVEDAAERVIGDGTEALRRAAADLDRLADAVNQEMREAAGEASGTRSGETAGEAGPLPHDSGESAEGAETPGQKPGQTPAATSGQAAGQTPGEGQQPGGMPSSPGLRGEGGEPEGGGRLLDQGQWTDSTGTPPIAAPLTGEGFREWSDAMRDVEQLIEDPDLRAEATRIRERARQMRREWNRQATEPQWPLVGEMVAQPLERLRREVSAELLRRSAEKNAVVPIDRDPVPERFSEAVQDYYERLGSGR
jgi:predicted house-cleaning noncanonical NTP pyrophosphatase (MazG superfamily)